MGWFSSLFSSVGVDFISSVGKVVDDLVTSDEEIALTEIQQAKIKAAYDIKIQELMIELDQQAADHEAKMESELTERLELDMKSDSWLSKNIRPMALIFMTAVVSVLAFYTVFSGDLTETQLSALEEWVPFFQILMVVMYGFYFGSRGLEKMQKMRVEKQGRLLRK
ncbi:MAG: 3TM-type holin [Gammaproteobacteria bacterium]|nr:3TM-type holin [Gammaproteobacteria bacterium]